MEAAPPKTISCQMICFMWRKLSQLTSQGSRRRHHYPAVARPQVGPLLRFAEMEARKRADSDGLGMGKALALVAEARMVAVFPAVVGGGAALKLNQLETGMAHRVLARLKMALQMGKLAPVHTM